MTLTVDMEADSLEDAENIGRLVFDECAGRIREIPGVRWMLPVGEFNEREPFAVSASVGGDA
jgi:hypothetical protein